MRLLGRRKDDLSRRADAVRSWAAQVADVTPIEKLEPRAVARIAGAVEVVRIRPREGVPAIEAVLSDGTGQVIAVWLGRRAMPGLVLGTRLIVEGRVGGEPPKLQIINPEYEFVSA